MNHIHFHLNHHFDEHDVNTIERLFRSLLTLGEKIVATQAEAAAQLAAIKTQLTKATDEIKARIQALVDAAAAAGNVDPGLQQAIDDLAPVAQTLDDIDPDATT